MDPMDDEIDPALVAVLAQLWRAAQESPAHGWSLAKLSKQAGVPMSSLQRHLTALADAGLAHARSPDAGTPGAALSDNGRELCAQLFRSEPGAGPEKE
jgi:DNA-binding transcriptional ArsR family regulator